MFFANRLAVATTLVALAGAAQAGNLSIGGDRMFNPQPEPPKTLDPSDGINLNPAGKFGFNPQPEPPPQLPGTIVDTPGTGK